MNIFEKNGLTLSSLTLGTAQIGLPYGIANKTGIPEESTVFEMLDYARKQGVVCYDTANAYEAAEATLGRYFTDKPAPTFISKLAAEHWGGGQPLVEGMMRQLELTLRNLNISRLPVLLLHHPSALQHHASEICRVFEQMKRAGLVDKTGISLTDIHGECGLYGSIMDGELFEVIQLPVNLFDHRIFQRDDIGRWRDAGKIVLGRSLFLQGGLLLESGALPLHLREGRAHWEKLQRLSVESGLSVAQLAVSFVRDANVVDSMIIGAETLEQVRHNLMLVNGPPIDAATRQAIAREFGNMPEQIINPTKWPKMV